MSAPYPTDDRNQYGGGMPPYPPQNVGFTNPSYPNPSFPPNPSYPPPPANYGAPAPGYQGGYDPNVGFAGYGQPAYPPQGFGGQPQGYGQPSYPQPGPQGYDPNKPPTNPPYMDPNDPNYDAKGFGFDDKSIRAGFIRRVYSILSIQLLVTLGFVCLFVLHEGVKRYAHRNPQLMIIPMVATIVLMCVIACCENLRRSSPTNIILLGAFTLCEAVLVGFISSTYKPEIVLMAVAVTAAIVIGLTLFAFQTKFDFTVMGGGLCIILLVFSIGSMVVGLFFRSQFSSFLIACVGAAIFSVYIVYDTQIMMGGNHKYSISPEEYVFASLNLYMDIIQLFLYMLRILQYLNRD